MDWVSVAQWTALAVGVVAGVILGFKEWKERRARAQGLPPNPTRCEDHEVRIRTAEKLCSEIVPRINNIEGDITEIKGDVKQLISMHLQK
ncbi:class II holin family protein [Candidatus Magnetobacterium casense]|uniref:Minor tail protein n=1 Tax=Candidatus Magnetobacterium casense TaxID=1455061 RepID=A0ABS6S3Q3_9BACT|nr:class II holin family protein [Candidatus Magnetobacterium casensis]MBV6343483.1 hypothetical protein [Candidatus Magnetobacterium casensis]